jgi:hypothetical protein
VRVLQARFAGSHAVLAHHLNNNDRLREAREPAQTAVRLMEPVARELHADWET